MSFKDLIMLNARDYLDVSSDVYINIIMLVLTGALCVASFVINYHKTYTVNIIKQLLRREATSEENAKTLRELRLDTSRGLKYSLARSNRLTSIISMVGRIKPTYEEYMALSKEKKRTDEKIDFETARFFIPKENVGKATMIKDKENPTVQRTVLVCVLIIALSVCLMLLMPGILTLLSNVGE